MIEQGTPEWQAMRCGKVTASRVADVMRSGRGGKPSASRARYMGELVTERLTGIVADTFKSNDMQWGNETEKEAANIYAFERGATLNSIAFVDHPTIDLSGCSPDRLVGDDGLIEIKCPASHTHIETLLTDKVNPDYVRQIHWQLACTSRAWCDFVSYDPRLPIEMRMYVKRFHRDQTAIETMEADVIAFLHETAEMVSDLKRKFQTEAAA